MANLIPPSAKKQVCVEYWVRVVSVWLFLVGTGLLVVAALNLPVYILIQSQLGTYTDKFNEANNQNSAFEKIESEIVESNEIAELLSGDRQTVSFVGLLKEFDVLASDAIDVTSFSFARDGTIIGTIHISGKAADRQSLVAFSEAIENHTLFESAEIPLSNLAKDRDIPFTITVIPRTSIE